MKKLIRKSFEFTSDDVYDILIEHLRNCGDIDKEFNNVSYGIYNEEDEEIYFFVVEYNGGNHAAFCSLDDGPIIAEVFEDYKSDSVHEDCPLRKKHYLVRLKDFPPKEDWVP
jgi:hypothetical protein